MRRDVVIDEDETGYGALTRANATLHSRDHVVSLSLRGVELHLREVGPQDGPTLMYLHGVFSDQRTWRFLTPLLAERYRIWLVDLPGCGRSRGPDPRLQPLAYSVDWIADVVVEALTRLDVFAAPVFLVGHSLGANVAWSTLERLEQAERACVPGGMVLIAPADPHAEEYPRVLRELAYLSGWEVSIGAALGVLDARIQAAVRRSVELPDERAFLTEAARLRDCLADGTRRRASQAMLRRFAHGHGGARVVPGSALLVWGGSDDVLPVVSGQRLSRRLGDAPLVIVPGTRHSVHQEAPAAVALEIRRFVDGRLASPVLEGRPPPG